jgi:hypothetical protein
VDRERKNAIELARYYKNKAAGICKDCPELSEPGKVRCASCVIKQRIRQHADISSGKSAARTRERIKKRRETGKCLACPNTLDPWSFLV